MPQRQFDFLTEGDHLCLIYHTERERFYSGILFILDGLKKGEMVVAVDEDVRDLLSEFVDVEFSVSKGQLVFLNAEEYDYDYRRLVDELKEIEAGVVEKGFKGFRYLINFDVVSEKEVLEYEAELTRWGKGIALCMFNGEKFEYSTLTKLLMIHPKLIIHKKTVENPLHLPQSKFILEEDIEEKDYSLLIRKILELHETIRELNRLRERYRAIYNSLPDGVFTLKGEIFVEVNARFAEMLELNFAKILGKKLHELSPKKQVDGSKSKDKARKVTEIAAEEGSCFFEWRFKKGSGFVDTEISMARFKLNGEYHLIGIVRDVTERKRMEEMLRQSEEKYRDLWENSNDMLFVVDIEGNFIDANKMALEVFGYTKKEIEKVNFLDILDESFREVAIREFKKRLDGKPSETMEFLARTRDGKEVWVEVRVKPIVEGGEVIAIQGMARDVTEKKRIIKDLKENEERFRKIFESSPNLAAILDEDGVFLEANPAMVERIGINPVGKSLYDVLPKEVADRRLGYLKKVLEDNVVLHFEDTKNGREYYNTFIPIKLGGKRYCFVIANDVTEMKRMNRLLSVINEINQLIVYEKNSAALLEKTCKRLFSLDEYQAVYIWLRKDGKLEVASHCGGFGCEKLEEECIKLAKEKRMLTPEERKNLRCYPRRPDLYCLIFPMVANTSAIGYLTLHSQRLSMNKESEILATLANDIAFALKAIELDEDKKRAYKQIEKNIEEFALLVDRIRNPLNVISGTAELHVKDEKIRRILLDSVKRIDDIVKRLDRGWIESEEVRAFLRKHL